jgi:hypothetical protein
LIVPETYKCKSGPDFKIAILRLCEIKSLVLISLVQFLKVSPWLHVPSYKHMYTYLYVVRYTAG